MMPHHTIRERQPAAPIPPVAALPPLGRGAPVWALVRVRAQAGSCERRVVSQKTRVFEPGCCGEQLCGVTVLGDSETLPAPGCFSDTSMQKHFR